MSDPVRYDVRNMTDIHPAEDGDYVRIDDYDQLQARLAHMEAHIRAYEDAEKLAREQERMLRAELYETRQERDQLQARCEGLEAELNQLKTCEYVPRSMYKNLEAQNAQQRERIGGLTLELERAEAMRLDFRRMRVDREPASAASPSWRSFAIKEFDKEYAPFLPTPQPEEASE